jgi:glycosyltransferase involved in cell wall biosynthesis
MSTRRVVYVVHADPGERSPAEVLRRFPTAPSSVTALHAHGGFEVSAVARTNGSSLRVEHDGVSWQFVRDRSRLGCRVALAVRRQRPEVVHVNGLIFSIPILLLRLVCGRRVRIVVQHHGESPGTRRTRIAQKLAQRAINAYLFTGADGQAEPWRRAGIFARNTAVFEVLESSADLEPVLQAEARERTGVVGSPAIVWVGRLNEGKDPLTAVRALAALDSDSAHVWMIFQTATLQAEVLAEIGLFPGLHDRVHLIGEVPHDDIGLWLSAADVFLSTSHHEGSGYSLIEALACGCTPVVSDIAPHRAIVGDLGKQFAPGDPTGCAAALSKVSVHTREDVIDDFGRRLSWPAIAEQLAAAYDPKP